MNQPTTEMFAWAGANFFSSAGVFFVCFCRAAASDKKVLKRVRAKFALLGSAFAVFACAPIWGQYVGAAGFAVSFATLLGLLAETYQWGEGPPSSVKFDQMPPEMKEKL